MQLRLMLVMKNIRAKIKVALNMVGVAFILPNILFCVLELNKVPILAPLPCCNSTSKMIIKENKKCNIAIKG